MSTLTFQLPEEQAEQLEEAARENGIPLDGLLRKMTHDYLNRQKAPAFRLSLAELIDGITDENRHGETDTGPVMGNEVW